MNSGNGRFNIQYYSVEEQWTTMCPVQNYYIILGSPGWEEKYNLDLISLQNN